MKSIKLLAYCLMLGISFFVHQEKVYASLPSIIEIRSVSDLKLIKDMSADYELMNDIDLSDLKTSPFINFTGDFDGNGFTLSNFSYSWVDGMSSEFAVGFFGELNTSYIHDLNLSNFNYTIASSLETFPASTGVLAGSATESVINNIIISNSKIQSNLPITTGGLVGIGYDGSISNIIIDNVELSNGGEYLGGAIGNQIISSENTVSIENVHTKIFAEGGSHIGGVFGIVYGMDSFNQNLETLNISNISSRGTIKGTDNLGGIFGDIILENLVAQDVTTKIHQIGLSGGSGSDVFNGLSASSEIYKYTINNLLIQSTFDNQTGRSMTANAFMDISDIIGNDPNNMISTNSYYIEGLGFSSSVLSPLKASDAVLQSSYVNYDFVNTWVIHPLLNGGIPYLRYPLKTISYDSNGGSAVSAQPYFPYEGSTAPSDPSLSGYAFNGWTLNGNDFDFSSTSFGTDLSLMANYTLIPVTKNKEADPVSNHVDPVPVSSTPVVSDPIPLPQTEIRSKGGLLFGLGVFLLLILKKLRH